jgi:hypothetical protein
VRVATVEAGTFCWEAHSGFRVPKVPGSVV